MNEDLRNWFSKSHPEGNWKRYNTKGEAIGPCAREPGEPKPKCLSNERAAKMSKDKIASAVRRKREKDPVADRKGKGEKPIMSSNKINEGLLDKLKGRKVVGRTGSGGKIYVPTKPQKSSVTYGGKTQDEIKKEREQKKVDTKRKEQVKTGEYSDPWLKSSPAAERRVHYQQLRGEAKEEKRYCMKCKKMESKDECSYGPEMWEKMTVKGFQEEIKEKQPNHENLMDEQKNPCWKGYKQVGMKKKNGKEVPNCVPEEYELEEENKPTNPKLWARAKSLAKQKFDVYPSAYANGWASKWYKSKGGGWKTVKEETIEDLNGNSFVEIVDLILPDPIKIEEATRIQAKTGNLMMVILIWRGKTYSLRIFFPQLKLPSKKDVEEQIQKVYPGAKVMYHKVTEHEPGQPFLHVEDWQKVNRQDKTDGLSQKAVNAYRRENPDSKLQTAVTEKNPTGKRADRRASFCRRMKGMKSKLTSQKTARDPDSRINKALRRWNCN